ncbi:hypothetical protein [Halotalea alkalilenta]|uniref:hypothetical protein n=1 Tax=Halotalea alkalilenta TaxID=376489 RepID=UPI0012DDD542|nr:hypothetical protein [Halotalea alkalilenta]
MEKKINKHGLIVNEEKNCLQDLSNGNMNFKLEYLGYEFTYQRTLKVDMSTKKLNAYKEKIDKAISTYLLSPMQMKHKRLLISRIRFLTGNTKLTNNKGGAFTGIFYSNRFINVDKKISDLDKYLDHKICAIPNDVLKCKLRKLKFKKGFDEKTFRFFSPMELSNITRIWK